MSNTHENITAKGNPNAKSRVINVIVQGGSDKAGVSISATCRIIKAVAA
jgi:hypothetical protein